MRRGKRPLAQTQRVVFGRVAEVAMCVVVDNGLDFAREVIGEQGLCKLPSSVVAKLPIEVSL